ncbi:hypothetical protein G6F57_001672 [Rhizopus arrhizus]|uniref:RGS domain-containing protein n=1 Tax=Rhizopus oryzae TaxID=64495 RepID=A0A9P7BWJ6_RHIOR|nr:hypothetical protein G6F24_002381 [Rhizopus arrhizus]KAG1424465.1 hypothetical protein G6F58_002357 [Rhizopus delemar]KAG0791251.1 hypothetical protein G6F21_005218 [Rhizopus arrhizus]KAG0801882.1 hypothetical protein G6F22_000810 [Rhizopus arrhizus]KAG0814761.1 hypothetical protein G6F20_004520 [Rhizopus arrhizus]
MLGKIKYNHSRKSSQSSASVVSTCQTSNITLYDALKDPTLLHSFEFYLKKHWSQEYLMFIKAVNQLRHEAGQLKDIEDMLLRIYHNFIETDSPMELNVTTKKEVEDKLNSLQWAVISREDAIDILNSTEQEVLASLHIKFSEFLGTSLAAVSSQQSKIYEEPNSFEYTPGIVSKIVNPERSTSLRFTHESYVNNGKVIIGYAKDITDDAKCVKVNNEKVSFDYLVLCTGTSYANQLKSTDSSSMYRTANLKKMSQDISHAKKVLIVGAGLVGCELAAAIRQKSLSRSSLDTKVVLVDSLSEVLHRFPKKQRQRAHNFLTNIGVEIILNERITAINTEDNDETYYGSSGRVYSRKDFVVLLATGVKVNTDIIFNSTNESCLDICLDSHGYIRVKPTLQIEHWKYNHIFAGGDITNVVEEKTAYAATIAGVCIARNICRLEKGKKPLDQGTKGLIAPPAKPLHGITSQGGIGKKSLNSLERHLSFLNPTWEALKYFNEKQYFKIVRSKKLNIIGRTPKTLEAPVTLQKEKKPTPACSQESLEIIADENQPLI